MIVRVLLWSLFESMTTVDELRDRLPVLEPPSAWVWNDASERFGLLLFGTDVPAELAPVRELIGREPDVFEEFDLLD